MSKKYKFDLNVASNALLQANPTEYYTKLYGIETAIGNFRSLAGIKNKTKIANVLFDQLTQEADCDFTPTNSTVDAIDIDVCALSAQTSVCQYQLEQSWLADQMAKGSNSDFTVASFMSYFWETMASKVAEEVELIRWQGDTLSVDTLLNKCDGHLKKLLADTTVIDVVAAVGGVTAANVIAEIGKVYEQVPSELSMRPDKLKLFVSPNISKAYRIAAASQNQIVNVTQSLGLTYLDIPIVECYGLPADTMIMTDPNNLIYAFDAEGDKEGLQIVDFGKTTLERKIGARADYKVGFFHTNGAEIVLYS